MSRYLHTPAHWGKRVLVKQNPRKAAPDPVASYLSRTGLRIDNSMRLSEEAGHWHPSACPSFLKHGRSKLPFAWLGAANAATYTIAGECRLLVEKVKEWFSPYDHKLLPRTFRPGPHWDESYRAHVEAYAYLGAFFCLLAGMYDSFSIEAALVTGWELPLYRVDFNRLVGEANGSRHRQGQPKPSDPAARILAREILGFLRGAGTELGWYEQFQAYRNMFAHRQSVLTFTNKEGRLVQQGLFTYLSRNPASRPVLFGGMHRRTAEDEQEVRRYMRRHFLDQPLTEYVPALFGKSVEAVDRGYQALVLTYLKRRAGALSYSTDYNAMLPAKWRRSSTAFRAFNQ